MSVDELKATPDDIVKLMEEEEKVIGAQTKKGNTSEESYTGGGADVYKRQKLYYKPCQGNRRR